MAALLGSKKVDGMVALMVCATVVMWGDRKVALSAAKMAVATDPLLAVLLVVW